MRSEVLAVAFSFELRAGFGGRFAAPFESRGIEDVADLPDAPSSLVQQILEELSGSCGAKELQLHQLLLHLV